MGKKNVRLKLRKCIAAILVVLILLSTSASTLKVFAEEGTLLHNVTNNENLIELEESNDKKDSEQTEQKIEQAKDEKDTETETTKEKSVAANENEESNTAEVTSGVMAGIQETSVNTQEEKTTTKSVKAKTPQNVASQTVEEEGFKVNLRWGGTSNTAYIWNAEQKEDRVIKLTFYYQNEVTSKGYSVGDLKVTVPGIGNLNRKSCLKATDIAADEYGTSQFTRDWSYKYDSSTDTYTFYNNKAIEKGESFSGSFELLWGFKSRESRDGYSQRLQATLNDGQKSVLSQELSLEFTSKKDTFYINKTATGIVSADGLNRSVEEGKSVSDYAWVQYSFRYNTQELNARGLQNRYLIDTFPEGCVVVSNSDIIKNEDGTLSYKIQENQLSEYDYKNYSIIVGYPEEYVGTTVENTVYLKGTYEDEKEECNLASDTVEVNLIDIGFNWDGYIVTTEKNMNPYYVYRDALNKPVNFSADLSASTSVKPIDQDEYSLALTDDLLEIYTDDYHRLTDDEYEFTSVTVPGKNEFYNANGYLIEDRDYTVTIKALYKDNVNTRNLDEYTIVYEGQWENSDIIKSLENAVAVRVEISGLTESIKDFYIKVSGKINIAESDYINPSYIINYSFTDFYDKSGNYLPGDITEENYSRTSLYNQDKEIYGKGLQRASDIIKILESNPGYYYANTQINDFKADEKIENFKTEQTHSVNVYNTNVEEITKIEVHGVQKKEELKTAIKTLKFTYRGLKFKYLLSDDVLLNDENMQDYLKERAKIEKNGTEIIVTFNFDDNPIVAENFQLGYTIESQLSYEDYYDDVNPSYRVETYALIEESDLKPQITLEFNGKIMAYNTKSSEILLAIASHQQLIKLVRTEYTNGEFVEDEAVVPLNTEYTYRLKLRNGYNTLEGTQFIDILEHSELTNVDGTYPYKESEWYGKLKNVDTKYIESKGKTVRVFYTNTTTLNEAQWTLMEEHTNGIWKTENDVIAIKVEIDGEIAENSVTHLDINMKAPTDESKIDKKTYNTYTVNADAIDIYSGIKALYLDNMPSNVTEVRLTKKEYNLEILKVDEENKNKLSGVQFEIYEINGEQEKKISTNLTGILGNTIVKNVKDGKYKIKETGVPLGYEQPEDYILTIDNESYTLEQGNEIISEGTSILELEESMPKIKITIENKRAKGSVTVYKIDEYLDENKQEIPLQGIEFELQDVNENVLARGTTNEEGKILFDNLPWGQTYVVKETKTLDAYELADSKNVYLSRLIKDKLVTVENVRKTGTAMLSKKDEIDRKPVDGATYGLYARSDIFNKKGEVEYEKDKLIKEETTNEEGKVIFDSLLWGDYYIQETKSTYGYELSEKKHSFTVNAETVLNIIQQEEKEKRSTASLQLLKLDEEGNFLQGAEFTLFNENGEEVAKENIETFEEELDEFENVDEINEVYKWTQNQNEVWCIGNENGYETNILYTIESNEFTLSYDGTIGFNWAGLLEDASLDYEIINTETEETIMGTCNTTQEFTSGTEYSSLIFNHKEERLKAGTYKISFTFFKYDDNETDSAYVKDIKVISRKIDRNYFISETDKNGQINIENIEWGNYYIKETKSPQGYEENNTKYYFTVNRETFLNNNNKVVASVLPQPTEENNTPEEISIIRNNKKKGKVSLTKYACDSSGEETTNRLKDAVYELYLTDGTKIEEYTSDDEGKIVANNLDWGAYYFQEKTAPIGYSVSNKKISFVINSNNVDFEQELEAYDKELSGEIKINKTIKADSLIATHGNASFMFKIVGRDESNEEKVTLYRTVTFSSNDEATKDAQGNITKAIVISDLERYKYEITEEENFRYELNDIILVTENSQKNERTGIIDLKTENTGEITFVNEKANNSLLTDSKLITNVAQSGYYLIGIGVKPKQDSYAVGTELTASDFKYTLYYSGGQEEEIELPQEVTFDGENTYMQEQAGDYIINVQCTLNEKTFESEIPIKFVIPNDYFEYTVIDSSKNIIAITGVNSEYPSPSVIYIPKEYDGYKVEKIGYDEYGLTNIGEVKSVVIEDGVAEIEGWAFCACLSLINITIPNSVKSIGEYAFADCSGLTSVTIPDSVESIGEAVFKDCIHLTSVTIGNNVTNIEDWTFHNCSSLTSVTIPDSVTSIGNGAFSSCESLTSVTIPNSVESIGDWTFHNCSGLTSVTIPDSVESIGDWTFYNCSNLTSVIIPDSVTTIGDSAFSGCSNLTSVTIPDSVESIGEAVFKDCIHLTSVTIGNNVTNIEDWTFHNCSSLTSVTIPDSVTSIGDWTFYNCSNLTSVIIPDSVTSIGEYAFADCSGLTSVTIPEGVTNIEDWTFYNCSNLTSVTIPDSVESIGDYAFLYCDNLTTIIYNGTREQFRNITIGSGNDKIQEENITFPED